MSKTVLPFGHWSSPIDGSAVAGKSRRFGQVLAMDEWVWWTETRPEEDGRSAVMRVRPGGIHDPKMMLPGPWSASSRIHEYGGGEFSVSGADVFFVNADDQDIYCLNGGNVQRITNAPDTRFADIQHDKARERLLCVAEHNTPRSHHPENFIAAIDLKEGTVDKVLPGHDFFGQLRLSPDGQKLAWISWDLPDMPWDQAELYTCELSDKGLANIRHVAGGDGVAAFQPEWDSAGHLWFVADESGFGQLYRSHGQSIEQVETGPGELSRPLWSLGMRSHARTDTGHVAASAYVDGMSAVTVDGRAVDTGFAGFEDPVPVGNGFAGYAALHDAPTALVYINTDGDQEILRSASDVNLPPDAISRGEIVRFKGSNDDDVVAIYYPPKSADCEAPAGTLPPAIVTAHGGPTGMAKRGLVLKTQYWTSRGFAVLDVDYSGSSGYGRAYRERLDGQWGVRDVEDVIAGARYLGESGRADPSKLAISGGSAGGYTVLMALATSDVFAAGGCHYGICDLAQLLKFTHKFESGYLYRLFGVDPNNWEETFAARSPINLMDGFSSPTIFFQGADDAVVPPAQSRLMVDALKAKGIPVAYHEFEGERHGFRKAETIETVLAAELAFFQQHLRLA